MTVLMLTPRMSLGYGVAEAVAMIVRELNQVGISGVVGCLEHDSHYSHIPCVRVPADPAAIADLAADAGAGVIIAHGSPYFEVLPPLTGRFRTVAYEYGDPTPELFGPVEAKRRHSVVQAKRLDVYPRVTAVAAISEFVQHDIGWPQARIIRLGVDHIPDLGPKSVTLVPARARPLRVGALMRMGTGEARYKGHQELLGVARLVESADVRFEVMGRGTDADADVFREAGIVVHLNAADEERSAFLRDIDVFVTASLWEGTNLPLVEAQSLGTPGLALDTGAHPEFTPLVFDSPAAMAMQIDRYWQLPELLAAHGRMSYRFVRDRFVWAATAREIARLTVGAPSPPVRGRGPWRRRWGKVQRLVRGIHDSGVRETIQHHWSRRSGS